MEQEVTVVVPLELSEVFAYFADAAQIGSWTDLPALQHDDPGELIGYEPPWSVAYRVTTVAGTHVLRVRCVTDGTGSTRVHLRQAGDDGLNIDLAALHRTLVHADHPDHPDHPDERPHHPVTQPAQTQT